MLRSESVAKKAKLIWPKVVEVVKYWQSLPKSKQPGKGKIGANTSFDRLSNAVNDPLVPVKLQLFDNVAKQFTTFLLLFLTDSLMTPFLVETLD